MFINNRRLAELLIKIHGALEDYLYPFCDKCNTKQTERTCKCDEVKHEEK